MILPLGRAGIFHSKFTKSWDTCVKRISLGLPGSIYRKNRKTHLIYKTMDKFSSFMTEVPTYRNQSIHLLFISMDWLLYDWDLRHERVNFHHNYLQ